MTVFKRGALCAALIALAVPARAETNALHINVPIGQPGSPTAQGVYQAQKEIARIPGGADVVPAKDFQKSYALTMKDMTAKTPGVLAQPRWGEESRLSIRGSGLSRAFHLRGITLLQDGVPFNFADGAGDFQEIDPLALQYLEVYRGGQGLRYGAATLGGAVNMVTPTARTVSYNGLLRAEGGSYQTMRLRAEAAKAFDGFDVFAGATKSVSEGYRRQSEQNNTRFTGNVGAVLGRKAETRFYLNWNDIDQEVPGTLTKRDALENPKSVAAVNEANDYARDVLSLRVSNRTVFEMDNGLKVEFGGYVNDKDLYHPIFQVVDQDSVDAGGFGRIKGAYGRNDFSLGMNAVHGTNDAKRFVNVGGKRGAMTANGEQIAKNVELYGENRFHINPQWSIIGGAQVTYAVRDYTDRLNQRNNADKDFKSVNPKAGVMWEPGPDVQVFASVTRSSELPTFSELVQGAGAGFIPVDMQKAWTAEVGTRGVRGAFSWDVTLYHSRVRDELLNYTVTPDVPASTFNADKTIHQGIEFGGGWQATNEISFAAIYNLNDFRFDGDAQFRDNDLAGAPKHQIRLSAKYQKNGFFIEPNVEWIPDAGYVDYANILEPDTYTVAGLKAGYDVNENVSLFFDARNLTNEEYIGSFTTITDSRSVASNVFYPGEGRSAYGGLIVKF